MRSTRGILLLISIFPGAVLAQELGTLVPDKPVKNADIEAVCTGVGLEARQNPAWASYPLKIEVTGRGGQYLGDARLILSQKDKTFATCRRSNRQRHPRHRRRIIYGITSLSSGVPDCGPR